MSLELGNATAEALNAAREWQHLSWVRRLMLRWTAPEWVRAARSSTALLQKDAAIQAQRYSQATRF